MVKKRISSEKGSGKFRETLRTLNGYKMEQNIKHYVIFSEKYDKRSYLIDPIV